MDELYAIITKHIAYEAALSMARLHEKELSDYFHPDLIHSLLSRKADMDTAREEEILADIKDIYVRPLEGGGLLEALWQASADTHLGMEIDLKAVPIKQETVEICEYFSMNPYVEASKGALLILSGQPQRLCRLLKDGAVDASIIGVFNKSNDRIIFHDNVRSFLNRPETYKL